MSRSVYVRDNTGTGWFIGIIVVLALLAISYLVFSANDQIEQWEPKPITTQEQKDFMLDCSMHMRILACEEKWEILSKAMN